MTSYQSKDLIKKSLREIIPAQVTECENGDELPEPLKELIIHNFQAKYVCYDKGAGTVEIGIENQESEANYPDFQIHTFKLEEAVSWLGKTFRKDEQDLKFYARLIAQCNSGAIVDDVVLV